MNDILEWHRKATKPTSVEERIDPQYGESDTWGDISRYYANDLDAGDFEAYWEKMTPVKTNGAKRSSEEFCSKLQRVAFDKAPRIKLENPGA